MFRYRSTYKQRETLAPLTQPFSFTGSVRRLLRATVRSAKRVAYYSYRDLSVRPSVRPGVCHDPVPNQTQVR